VTKWVTVLVLLPCLLLAQTSDSVETTDGNPPAGEAPAEDPGAAPTQSAASEADSGSDEAVRITPEELAQRALEISAREVALRELEARVVAQIAELRELQAIALTVLEPERAAREEELAKLVGFYQNMKPKQAAGLMEKLALELATEILSRMKRREAAKILNVMARTRAVEISQRMTRKPQ
jgi:flagellar motility protein MotE (MotC chaperone)